MRRSLILVFGLVIGLGFGLGFGCKLLEDNPDAPDVVNPGSPTDWPVFKETNNVSTNIIIKKD